MPAYRGLRSYPLNLPGSYQRPSADGTPTGGIWIIDAESHAAAETFYKDDPFWKAGLRKSVRVSHWAKAYWSPAYAECMRASGIA